MLHYSWVLITVIQATHELRSTYIYIYYECILIYFLKNIKDITIFPKTTFIVSES